MSQTEKCLNYDGEGVVHTGVDEAPTMICPACDGDGGMDVFAAPAVANAAVEFPEPQSLIVDADIGHRAYSTDQMRAYGQACSLAAQAPKAALTDAKIMTIVASNLSRSTNGNWVADTDEVKFFARRIEAAAAPNAALVEALKGLVDHLIEGDEEGLIGHAEPMVKARAALAAAGVKP